MNVTDTLNLKVQYEDQFMKLVLVITAGNGPNLLARNCLNHIKLNWKNLFAVRMAELWSLHTLMSRHKRLFVEGLGKVEFIRYHCRFSREPSRDFSNLDQYHLLLEMQ